LYDFGPGAARLVRKPLFLRLPDSRLTLTDQSAIPRPVTQIGKSGRTDGAPMRNRFNSRASSARAWFFRELNPEL